MRKLFIFGIALLLSCQENSTKQAGEPYFDLPGFTEAVIMNMDRRQANITKTFRLKDRSETKDFKATDSLFWTKELDWLRKTDLNAPKFRGLLTINRGEEDTRSNLLIDRISVTGKDTNFREIEIYYLDNLSEIRLIKMKLASQNFIAKSEGQLTVWLNRYNDYLLIDSLIAKEEAKVLFQKERNYQSRLVRKRQ